MGTPTPANRSAPRSPATPARCSVWRSAPTGAGWPPAGNDGTVRLWDPDTGQPIGDPLTGHTGAVYGRGVQPRRAADWPPASADNTVRLWDPDTGQPIGAPLTGHTGAVLGVAFSPDGQRLAIGRQRQARCGCGTPTPASRSARR